MMRILGACICALALTAVAPTSGVAGGDRTTAPCSSQGSLRHQVAPKHCLFLKRGCPATSACYVATKSMSWNWGRKVARGKGKRGISTAGLFPVKIRLTKPQTKCGHRVFTTIKVRGTIAGNEYTDKAKLQTCD